MIEAVLEAFGIFVKVREIIIEEKYYEYLLDVAVGTSFTRLERRSRELEMALATTEKVKWRMHIPGKALIGLQVPKPSKEYLEAVKVEEKRKWEEKSLRNVIAFIFYSLGQLNYRIAYFVLGKSESIRKNKT